MTSPRIAVVVGSTRPTRICTRIAGWARDVAQDGSTSTWELVDLAEVGLPFLDEPLKPALHRYEHDHTRAWSHLVSAYDGFLFVFPQYNWGYPAVLKNAVDYLYEEWHGKPGSVLTYGTRGGNKAAAQFLEVMRGLGMRVLDDHVEAVVTDRDVDPDWQLVDVDATLRPVRDRLRAVDARMAAAVGAGA